MLFLDNSAIAQYHIHSWSVRVGADFSRSHYKSDFFRSHFDSAPYLFDDFSSFHFDPNVQPTMDPPMLVEFDLAIAKIDKSKRSDYLDYRFKLGVCTHELGYDNYLHETYYPYYEGVNSVVFRDFYGFTFSCYNTYLGFEPVYNSKPFGRKQRLRYGVGIGLQAGITELDIYVSHLEGYYKVDLDVNDEVSGDYIYHKPAISFVIEEESDAIKRYGNFTCYAFADIERTFFRRRNSIFGLQFSIGSMWIYKETHASINSLFISSNLSFRFLLGKFKTRKQK